ncbi:MAG: iron chaperone [Phototrophicaceae bacterium]
MDINQYFLTLKNPKHHDELQALRAFIQQTMPTLTEGMDYGMPTYSSDGKWIVALASQKNYMALYMDMEQVEHHRAELGKLDCGKSCIRFTKLEKLPLDVIATILHETLAKHTNG